MNKITVSELEIIFQQIISKLRFYEIDEIKLESDFYQLIPTEQWDNFDDFDADVGSLFDDVNELKKLSNDKDRITTFVDFDRLASVLRYMSQKYNPIDK